MRNCLVTSIVILLIAFAIACGGSSSATNEGGNWTITTVDSGNSALNSTFNVSLVPGNCEAPNNPYPTSQGGEAIIFVSGPSGCFIGDGDIGQGSISGTGYFFSPPQTALVGLRSPPNSPSELDLMFIEAGPNDQYAVFDGSGTITNSTMTGTWSCSLQFTSCSGMSGTFSGSKQ